MNDDLVHAISRAELPSGVTCPDCGVEPGTEHLPECDVARCLFTGEQRLQHELDPTIVQALVGPVPRWSPHDCGHDIWTGEWPLHAEAVEYGWYVRWNPTPHTEANGITYPGSWQPCEPGDDNAVPDLNRVAVECVWDRHQRRFVLPTNDQETT
jgi:hypothetical protein